MSLMVAVNPDSSISVRIEDGGVVHRYVLQPGHYDERGAWIDVDLSGEPQEAIDLAGGKRGRLRCCRFGSGRTHGFRRRRRPARLWTSSERDRIAIPLAVQVPSLGAAIRINMDEKSQRNVQGLCGGGHPPVVGSAGAENGFPWDDNVSRPYASRRPGANRPAGDGAHSGGLSTRTGTQGDGSDSGRLSRR